MTPASTADLRDLLNADDTLLYFFWIQALIACLEDPVRSFMSAMAATIFSVSVRKMVLSWSVEVNERMTVGLCVCDRMMSDGDDLNMY